MRYVVNNRSQWQLYNVGKKMQLTFHLIPLASTNDEDDHADDDYHKYKDNRGNDHDQKKISFQLMPPRYMAWNIYIYFLII